VIISELMISNKQTLKDEDGDYPDWLELQNTGTAPLSLAVRGWLACKFVVVGVCLLVSLATGACCCPEVELPHAKCHKHLQTVVFHTPELESCVTDSRSTCPPASPACRYPPAPLQGYKLADSKNPGPEDEWTFPGVTLNPNQYLVVFASGKDRALPSSPLHTNFKLSANDGYVALLGPSGSMVQELLFPE